MNAEATIRPEPAASPAATAAGRRWSAKLRAACTHGLLRAFVVGILLALRFGRLVRGLIGARRGSENLRVVLTGTFHSVNWIDAHVTPLALARTVARVDLVTTLDVTPSQPQADDSASSAASPFGPNVFIVAPPRWLRALLGDVPARLVVFAWTCVRRRPHVVGGFHLLLNGLAAGLVAPWVRARALYFNVGGPWEVLDGGIRAENRLFSLLRQPDALIERMLVRCVATFDIIVTMGSRAARYWRANNVRSECHVVSGGIDATRFDARPGRRAECDLVFVGRLAPIKRVDVLLESIALLRRNIPGVTATIVGDGELRASLESQAQALGLADCVRFAGKQSDVASFLRRARVFVLTSDSEGLPLSVLEAMLCGLPAVVTDVGDLRDLITDGVNGRLVPPAEPQSLAAALAELLSDDARRNTMAAAARAAALRYDLPVTAKRWDAVLVDGMCDCQACSARAKGRA